MRRKGFTLIELLVVIAIIAILAAILFPVFAQARAKARAAACLSNMKQITLATMMYADDYDECVPQLFQFTMDGVNLYNPSMDPNVYKGPVSTWSKPSIFDGLQPYMKNQQLWVCPGNGQWLPSETSCANQFGGISPNICSFGEYFHAGYKGATYNFDGKPVVRSLSGFTNPSMSVLWGDGGCRFFCETIAAMPEVNWSYLYLSLRRHNGGSNYGFADGHAKWAKPEMLAKSYFTITGLAAKFQR